MIMTLKKFIYGIALGALSLTYTSCYNADKEFPDYQGGTTAYFAYQFPVRTLVLGNDIYDNTLDNAHKCRIWSTMGGAYGGRDASVSIVVDPTLCDNLYFTDAGGNAAEPVRPMPASYYQLSTNAIQYNGDARGYVEVQFTDEFFNDPKAIENTYVIPLLMMETSGIDHILRGSPLVDLTYTPSRTDLQNWDVLAKDYVLYCVKYMNPWQGKYIRRGVDVVSENNVAQTYVRKDTMLVRTDPEHYTENPINQNDEICSILTKNMTQATFPVSINIGKDASGAARPSQRCNLILTFNGNDCTISTDGTEETIAGSGSGEYIAKGTERAEYKDYQWGSMNGEPVQRDILRLAYSVTFKKGRLIGTKNVNGKEVDWILENDVQVSTADTLVVQTRESNQKVFFSPKYVKN